MKTTLFLLVVLLVRPVFGQVPVIDGSVLVQVIEDVRLATEQLQQLQTEVERLGNPAAVKLEVAQTLLRNLMMTGVGKTLDEVRTAANGSAALHYDGNGLYRPPGDMITTADGNQVARAVEEYRKFDAIAKARAALEDVMRDTENRRQQLRQQIKDTLTELQSAPTLSAVNKLSGVLIAENAELSAIDREREAALSRLLAQKIENENNAAQQALAEREERAAAFRAATQKLSQFLTPNASPVSIPDPRTLRP